MGLKLVEYSQKSLVNKKSGIIIVREAAIISKNKAIVG